MEIGAYVIHTHDARENELLDLMENFIERFPKVHLASMPHFTGQSTEVEFGVCGDAGQVRLGMKWLTGELNARGYRWEAVRD